MIGSSWARGPRAQAAGVFLACVLIGAATADVPWSDDARFYVPAAEEHGRWIARVLSFDGSAFTRPVIDAAFSSNAEHPPVAKMAMGLTWLLLHEWTGWLDGIDAARVAVILLWALMCAALFGWVRRVAGGGTALFAAAALVSMPRLFYDGRAETLDVPVATFMVLAAAALFRCLEEPRLRTGVAAVVWFALALGTKLNAPFLLVGAVVYVWMCQPLRLERSGEGSGVVLPAIPGVLLGMVLVSPLVTWALWPWLWFDTLERLNGYLLFHLQHYGIHFYYAGVLYGDTVAPVTAPLVLTALTMPVPVFLLALLGAGAPARIALGVLGSTLRGSRVPGLRRLVPGVLVTLRDDRRARLGVFVALQAGVQLAAVSLPGVPKYAGTKLFLPLLPFAAVLAALGFELLTAEVAQLTRRPWVRVALAALLLAPGIAGAVVYRDVPLSYYNELAGGLRGATAAGFERQYYDLAYPQLAAALSELLPRGGGVAVLPNAKEYVPHIARWQQRGELPRTIRPASVERADVLVLTHERRWAEYPELMAAHRTRPLLYRYDRAGVPLFSIYDLRAGR